MKKQDVLNIINDTDIMLAPDEEGKWFGIVPGWNDIGKVVINYNKLQKEDLIKYGCHPDYVEEYWEEIQRGDLRLGRDGGKDHSPYLVPDGLVEFDDILMEAGIEDWGFEDNYDTCSFCGMVIRTIPDSYGWTPEYWQMESGERCCVKCLKEQESFIDEYIESMKQGLKNCDLIDIEEYGYAPIDEEYSTGLYGFADDSPEKIKSLLNQNGIDVIFQVYPGPYSVDFTVYVPKEKLEEAMELFANNRTKYDYGNSPLDNLKKGLKETTEKMSKLPAGEGVRYAKIKKDGTVDARTIPLEEFINKIKK